MTELEADLVCDQCGVSASIVGLDEARLDHVLTVFAALHGHTVAETATWRASVERIHQHHDVEEDD